MNDLYKKKPNGRYEKVGIEWTGFPANGIWLVQDGKQQCILQLSDSVTNPFKNIRVHLHIPEVEKAVYERAKDIGVASMTDLIKWTAEEFAKRLEYEKK